MKKMGKSTSCFKIISCGKDSADNDDLEAPESKSPSDKRGWSFRKRAARHRVLSNTVIIETPTSGHKETPESASATDPEKISLIHCSDEKPQLVTPENPKVSETEQKVSQTEPKVLETEPNVPEAEQKAPETEPNVPEVEGKASETQPKVPETEQKVSQTEPKIPETEPEAEQKAPETEPNVPEAERKAPETEPNVPEAEGKAPETEPHVPKTEPNVPVTEPKVPETEPKVSNTENVTEDESAVKCKSDEYDVIVVQTASRGLLDQKSFMELENVVKLQAAVRGHLVRRHAVGTLRCVQALVKMQALVRARRARQEIDRNSKISEKAKSNITYTSIDKLLSNSFASRLLESSPKTKPMHAKCDSSNPGSFWDWMERWTSLSSPSTEDIAESEKAVAAIKKQERRMEEISESPQESKIQDEVLCEISDSKSNITESIVPSESEENPITYDADNLNFQASHSDIDADNLNFQASHSDIEQPQLENNSTSDVKEITEEINYLPNQSVQSNAEVELKSFSGNPVMEIRKEEISESPRESKIQDEVFCEIPDSKSRITEPIVPSENEENLITYDADNLNFQASHSNSEQPQLENNSTSDVKEITEEINYLPNQSVQSNADSQVELKSFSGNPVTETEQPKRSMKRLASEELETEGKKSVFGSGKVSNPAFIAAQSKFEVLSSTTNSGSSISPSHQDDAASELQRDTFSSAVDTEIRKELNIAENPVTHVSSVQVGGSECGTEMGGTEISVSSTLDSPNRSDVGAMEHEHGAKVSAEGDICNPDSTENVDVQAKDFPTIPVSNLFDPVLDKPEKHDVVNGEIENSVVAVDSPQAESQPERTESDLQKQQDPEAGIQAYASPPEASPRSHLTVPESQGTPSSLISVKAKRSKADKSGSNQKRKSASAGKNSPSNPNQDSGLNKDQKKGKRRNSFGSEKPAADKIDQEPRHSSSNSSIPHFMQATESARAKLQTNTSPRSSPDMQDRDINIKKRHSLPGTNGRQGSPRIQQSTTQAQPGAKTNERKWNR
ncbi:protein IQ-DOMAIN 32 isoform X1 [Pyrus x bretschneideri]|uniref:protein IQ-DOMAIN 32 isoform X1 n=1 Tax=Pyrus x bretschneideri TaxID=225117 RepID=UPI00051114B5|nr:protein IQ-DOMAIN 32 isoform X1 [Pyrus x bretschneideri]